MGGYRKTKLADRGTRYLRSTHLRVFVSFVAQDHIGMRAELGVATLIVVSSGMNGFERELRSRILSVTSHATILGLPHLADWRYLAAKVAAPERVQPRSPTSRFRLFSPTDGAWLERRVRGVLPQEERPPPVSHGRYLPAASMSSRPGAYGTILGSALAHERSTAARVRLGVLIAPEARRRHRGRAAQAAASAWWDWSQSGMYEFDGTRAGAHGGRRGLF